AQPTRARIHAVLMHRDQAASTAELARQLDLRPSGVRVHLEQMRSAGLVVRSSTTRARGRPLYLWSLPALDDRPPNVDTWEAAAAADYGRLAELRAELRRYLAWAEEQAKALGTTPAHFQLLLAIRASPDPRGPTLTDLADTLQLRHHSVIGLVDRAEAVGLVARNPQAARPPRIRVTLTQDGQRLVSRLTSVHVQHLAALAPQMQTLWATFAIGADKPQPDAPTGLLPPDRKTRRAPRMIAADGGSPTGATEPTERDSEPTSSESLPDHRTGA
ncbi:MAG: MarR family winged helix-turn-helix transcriptional regulator, partial [Solirubrobacteraceae bacterium]